MCGDCTLIASDTGFTTVSDAIASKSYRCGIQVAAVALLFNAIVRGHKNEGIVQAR